MGTNNNIKPLLIFLFLILSFSSLSQAKDFTQSDFKIALVGQFIKHINWPNQNQSDSFSLVVVEDKSAFTLLSALNGETIKEQMVTVTFAEDLSTIPAANLVYLSKAVSGNVNRAIANLRGKATLVITENHHSLHNVMLNIIDEKPTDKDTYQLKFQINKPNLLSENLIPNPELVLLGGTELDVVEMYRQAELAMSSLQTTLWRNQQQLDQQILDLEQQRNSVLTLNQELKASQTMLERNQQALDEKQRELDEKQTRLALYEKRLQDVQLEKKVFIEDAERKLLIAQRELWSANQELTKNQKRVDEAGKVLMLLESQVASTSELLSDTEQKLLLANQDLKQHTTQVKNQAQVIDRQSSIILTSIISLIIFIIATVLITKVSIKNKRISGQLESALEDLTRTQKDLVESEKLASLGRLVAGVAHEFNTPLGVVITSSSTLSHMAEHYTELLDAKRITEKDLRQLLQTLAEADGLIQNNLNRCTELIQNFKQISSEQVVAANQNVHMKDNIIEVMNALAPQMEKAEVKWRVEGDNPEHQLDPYLLAQVLKKLIENAIVHGFSDEADKLILVRVTSETLLDKIEFIDNGTGMDRETKSNIFEPFFTTNRDSGGTGLGMNIVHNLVTSKLNGSIEVESALGKGTRLVINLPKEEVEVAVA